MQSYRIRQFELRSESDELLVREIREGDQFALKELFRRYYSGLFRFAFRTVHSKEDVEDMVEAVFEKLWMNRRNLDPAKAIRLFLYKAVQNQTVDFMRRKGRSRLTVSSDVDTDEENQSRVEAISSSDPSQELVERELEAAVKKALERLPKKTKVVFTLNRQDGLTYSEIAELLGISVRTVEHQIVRALKLLRVDLKYFIG